MKISKTETYFFTLLKISVGQQAGIDCVLSDSEWNEIYAIAKKQALLGIIFDAISLMPKEKRPPFELLMKWVGDIQKIENANRWMNSQTTRVYSKFASEGFKPVILKGQGNALWYTNPLHRQPGDIDIWLDGGRNNIMNYVRRFLPHAKARYHHVDFPVIKNTEIEIHFTPSWLSSFCKNKKLQQCFVKWHEESCLNSVKLPDCEDEICVPSDNMNRVYLLLHIYRHFFDEGIGLRQVLDYYLLLKRGVTAKERGSCESKLKELGLLDFSAALMYVLQEIFGMESEYMLVNPDPKKGVFLLQEILKSGTFGIYNKNIVERENKSIQFYWSKLRYKIRFISQYPAEVFWGIIFWIWQYVWRKIKRYA